MLKVTMSQIMLIKSYHMCPFLAAAYKSIPTSISRQVSTNIQPIPKVVQPIVNINKTVTLINTNVVNAMIAKLQSNIPRSLPIIGVLKNASEGRVLCKVHTDTWPEFSTVVCEIVYPRVSEIADLLCYSTGSGDDILQLLHKANAISWGKKQQLYHLEDCQANDLLQNWIVPGTKETAVEFSYEAVASYLPKNIQVSMSCPEGFVMGTLKAHHASLVASKWKKYSSWQKCNSYIEGLISEFDTKAVFHQDDLDYPVAWIMQYPFGRLAGLYTLQEYRQNDFGTLLTVALSKSIAESGLIPEALTEINNAASRKITGKLGFIESKYHLQWLCLKNNS